MQEATNLELPHVIRKCESCGDDFRVCEPGKHGIGFQVKVGDRPVIPAGFIKLAANPLKGSGQLSRPGLEWFAKQVFGVNIATKEARDNFLPALEKIQESNEVWFTNAHALDGLAVDDPANADEIYERLSKQPESLEWWGYTAAFFAFLTKDAIVANDAAKAAWAMACSERFRALAAFKEHFAEVVFMGHSAGRLIQLLRLWDKNHQNGDEGFWQKVLGDHAYAFSQLFSVPVTFIEGHAYVGGTQIDGKDARYLDFMLSGGSANDAILLEIKTPTTRLLSKRYRGNAYAPSRDLTGSIVQVQDYCDVLMRNIEKITKHRGLELNTFNPRRMVIIGNYEKELTDPKLRASFELFRSSISSVEVITFDELFRKIEQLAKLFNLVRTSPADGDDR